MGLGVDKIKELFSTAGQCLFLTQQIESMFKVIFPFVSDGVDPKPVDLEVFTCRKEFIENKTLGCVINLIKQKEFGYCQRTSAIVTEFIDMRNQFVHHKFSPSNFSLDSQDDLDDALDFLKKYMKSIKLINDLFEPIMLWLFDIFISSSHDNQKLLKVKELLNSRISRYNTSIENRPCNDYNNFFRDIAEARSITEGRHVDRREIWEETSIIKAIYKAIEECEVDDEGWVSLSSCATKMSSHTNLTKDAYGFKKLSDLIKTSELFDFCDDKHKDGVKIQAKIRKRPHSL